MPVIYGRGVANLKWKVLDQDLIKDLRRAVKEGRLGSPRLKELLNGIYHNVVLTPYDCRYLPSIILTNSQYILWDLKWRKFLTKLIESYAGGPYATLTLADLAEDPPHNRAEYQAADLPTAVLNAVRDAACKALLLTQPAGTPEESYTQIRQGPAEPYSAFVDRLTQALERQCEDDVAAPILLHTLAYANANEECKMAIRSLQDPKPGLPQMIESCSKIGSPQHLAIIQANTLGESLAKAVTTQMQASNDKLIKAFDALSSALLQYNKTQKDDTFKKCHQCGKSGHVIKNCPEPAGATKPPNRCPRCKKGRHCACQCHSKYDIDGNLLTGNSKNFQGAGYLNCPHELYDPTLLPPGTYW